MPSIAATFVEPNNGAATADEPHPTITSYRDLTIVESGRDPVTGIAKSCMFYHVTADEKVYYGVTTRNKRDLSFDEFSHLLQRVRDEEIFPEVPRDIDLKLAPDHLGEFNAFVKRPGMAHYDEVIGTDFVWKELLHEAVIMEQISKTPHPYIIRYDGCRVRRGRITAIFLERLDQTLDQYVNSSADGSFEPLDNDKFLAGVQSAVCTTCTPSGWHTTT
ncbi:hypothetical protein B0T21DRAFT_375183 [Apiosordaria backusii]|uniref:Uncharacterized protein n=1 Tax=Apiosordaria backusii TaxID=314023 RepID=A0AA40AIQ7_9PEZI|nr:hypothetical protein B0T21DRAFT_375183 [Apiosordaria backusii]